MRRKRELMVYVLDKDGKPLMPTNRHGKVRHLLKDGKAKCVKREPFTIQLLYDTPGRTQPVHLGVDAGFKHVGLSACTSEKELYSAECELRTDINKNLETRRSLRRSRRNRKTRYCKPRFQNRRHSKPKRWLAPSVREKADCHVTLVRKVIAILPVSEITIEMAPFDTQKLKADMLGLAVPKGTDYQHGEAEGYDNIKAYVKWRDGGRCRICGSHEKLEVHHRIQRKDGGTDTPPNLITACRSCHTRFHAGTLKGKNAHLMLPGKAVKPMNDAAFMTTMRWAVWNKLKKLGVPLHMTFGYITAERRKQYGIEKSHRADARCISGLGNAEPADEWFAIKKVRCHNRQIHKQNPSKSGVRRLAQNCYVVRGFRLYDKVLAKGRLWYIAGRRTKGAFVLKNLCGEVLNITPTKITFVKKQYNYVLERRTA